MVTFILVPLPKRLKFVEFYPHLYLEDSNQNSLLKKASKSRKPRNPLLEDLIPELLSFSGCILSWRALADCILVLLNLWIKKNIIILKKYPRVPSLSLKISVWRLNLFITHLWCFYTKMCTLKTKIDIINIFSLVLALRWKWLIESLRAQKRALSKPKNWRSC